MTNEELHASLGGLPFNQQVDVVCYTLKLHGDEIDVQELQSERFTSWCRYNASALAAYFGVRRSGDA